MTITNEHYSTLSTNSRLKIKKLIFSCSPRFYPKSKSDYIPRYTQLTLIEAISDKSTTHYRNTIAKLKSFDLAGFEWKYNSLLDEYSKEMLITALVYKLFDTPKIRFPVFYSQAFDSLVNYDKLKISDKSTNVCNGLFTLSPYDLSSLSFNLKIWYSSLGILINFVHKQLIKE